MKKFSKLSILGIGALVVIMLITMYGEAAVKSIAGLAIAQSATKWNSIKDAAFGDNATKGIMAVNTYLYDGTNFDRQRGDSTNGMDVDITRLPGGGNTPADAFTTPTNTLNTNTFNMLYNGTTWDMARGDSTNGTLVNLGANNDVVADTELGPAGIVGDNETSPTATLIYNFPAVFDGSAWDRMRGDSVNGILVNLGTNNDITVTSGNITADTELSVAAALADATANPTTSNVGALVGEFNGTTWDRLRHSFNQSTTAITTAGAGVSVNMTTTPMSKYTMIIDRTAGTTNVIEVDLECSLDGTIFVQMGTITDLSSEPALTSVDGSPCNYMRYNVVTVGAGNTLTIQLLGVR